MYFGHKRAIVEWLGYGSTAVDAFEAPVTKEDIENDEEDEQGNELVIEDDIARREELILNEAFVLDVEPEKEDANQAQMALLTSQMAAFHIDQFNGQTSNDITNAQGQGDVAQAVNEVSILIG